MITDIWVAGQRIDMYADADIRHTFQVNDIAEVKDRQASFTNSFSIPKTANNVRIFKGLGISSDTSGTPYDKPTCQVKIDGFDLITKGWMNVTDTDDEDYKIYIYSGIIEFFKAIENKTIGKNLDLSEIDHTKTIETVTASFNNVAYKYLVADYGGEVLTEKGNINIDYLMPSLNAKWLWDKIFNTFGFRYSGSVFGDLASKYISYPKSRNVSEQLEEYAELKGTAVTAYRPNLFFGAKDPEDKFVIFDNKDIDKGFLVNYGKFETAGMPPLFGHYVIVTTGNYEITVDGTINFPDSVGSMPKLQDATLHLIRNGLNKLPSEVINDENVIKRLPWKSIWTDNIKSFDVKTKTVVQLSRGETIGFAYRSVYHNYTNDADVTVSIKLIKNQSISFSEEFNDFAIKDFIKEVLNLYGLTAFPSEHSNEIKFLTVKERVNQPVKDWSGKYIRRTGERYIYNDYAQKNIFRYKYTDKDASYYDAAISISNKNIPEQKVVYDSKFYSPERDFTTLKIAGQDRNVYVFKMWDREIKKDKIEYKSKDNRFFFIQEDLIREAGNAVTYGTTFESGLTGETKTMLTVPVGSFAGIRLQDFVNNYYLPEFTQIVESSKIHNIELDLYASDILTLDMSALYYFTQEHQYYIMNKLNFDEDRQSGEFVRVMLSQPPAKAVVTPPEPTEPENPTNPETPSEPTNPTNPGTNMGELQLYCFNGRYSEGDPIHPPGYVKYIDSDYTESVWDGITIEVGTVSFYARTITGKFGVTQVVCE